MNTKEKLQKNKPNKIIPIMNTCFSVIFIVGAIFLFIDKAINFTLFLLGMILFVLFPLTSWYNQYFLKKKNTKKIYNYEHETKEIVAYVKRMQKYQAVEINGENKLKVTYTLEDEIIAKTPNFDKERCSLGLPREDSVIVTFGVSFAGLEFKGYSKEFYGLVGILPRSVWYKKNVIPPLPKKGKINIEPVGFNLDKPTLIQTLKHSDTYYNNKTGWLLIGDKKPTVADEAIEIMKDVIVIIRFEEIVGVWIKLEEGLAI